MTHQPSKSDEEIVEEFLPTTSFDGDPFVGEALRERKETMLNILKTVREEERKKMANVVDTIITTNNEPIGQVTVSTSPITGLERNTYINRDTLLAALTTPNN